MIKPIAFYLPQFHPIPENDEWWGRGFTEWTNVSKARPLYRGHLQPRLPADFGFYDLRIEEVREQQASLAREHGIFGFCYYHYWFGNGKVLLERPVNEVLKLGKPNFPFCFCWANETWEGRWHGISDEKKILIKQNYGDREEILRHFDYLLPFFKDDRYIRINNKPLFQVYRPSDIENHEIFCDIFDKRARQEGFDGIYFMGGQKTPIGYRGYLDSKISSSFAISLQNAQISLDKLKDSLNSNRFLFKLFSGNLHFNKPVIIDYCHFVELMHEIHIKDRSESFQIHPIIINDFDNTPRAGKRGVILKNANPENFAVHVRKTLSIKSETSESDFVFIKSWNEWAEGNYLEPDNIFGLQYLKSLKLELNR